MNKIINDFASIEVRNVIFQFLKTYNVNIILLLSNIMQSTNTIIFLNIYFK